MINLGRFFRGFGSQILFSLLNFLRSKRSSHALPNSPPHAHLGLWNEAQIQGQTRTFVWVGEWGNESKNLQLMRLNEWFWHMHMNPPPPLLHYDHQSSLRSKLVGEHLNQISVFGNTSNVIVWLTEQFNSGDLTFALNLL